MENKLIPYLKRLFNKNMLLGARNSAQHPKNPVMRTRDHTSMIISVTKEPL